MVRNRIQELRPQPPMSLCLLERKRADETGDTIWTSTDCRTPFLDRCRVQGDPAEKMASRSSQPCGCDQRAGFQRLAVIGKIVDNTFDEFLRQLHLFDIVQS